MSVSIVEKYIKGKENIEEKCEDGLVITNDYIAVIGGVTAKGKML